MTVFCHTFHTNMAKPQPQLWGHAEISKNGFRSADWARTEARHTNPSPRSHGSLDGGGCARALVMVRCDKRKVAVVGGGL